MNFGLSASLQSHADTLCVCKDYLTLPIRIFLGDRCSNKHIKIDIIYQLTINFNKESINTYLLHILTTDR